MVLARGADRFVVRLGEKTIPVPQPPVETASSGTAPARPGMSGNPGGFGGRGRRQARAGGARRTGFGGGNPGGLGRARGPRNRQAFAGPRVPLRTVNRAMSRTLNGGGARRGSQFSRTAAAPPTSNPQTARRRGGQLVGGAQPEPEPQALANPQTQRRLGTTTGPAFGSAAGGVNHQSGGVRANGRTAARAGTRSAR